MSLSPGSLQPLHLHYRPWRECRVAEGRLRLEGGNPGFNAALM